MPATILVIDDDPDVLGALELILEDQGFQVVTAVNGADALGKVRAGAPSVILLDLMMPVMDGAEFCRRLRAEGSRIPVVVISADRALAAKAQSIGATAWLGKPFDLDELLQKISQCLAGGGGEGDGLRLSKRAFSESAPGRWSFRCTN